MSISVLVLVVAVYAAVATAYLEARRHREPPPRWARIAGPLSVAAHLVGLVWLGAEIGRSPFSTPAQALSYLAFSLVALYLVLEATSRVATHGGGFYALAALLAALGVPGLIHATAADPNAVKDAARTFHSGLSLMGTAAVLAAGLLAGGYLGTYRRVKQADFGGGAVGPSLRGFERLERRACVLGVLFFAPAVWMGIRTMQNGPPHEGMAALLGLTVALLVLTAIAGWIWWRRPLRGRLAAWLNILAMVAAILATVLVHPLVTGLGR